MAVRIRKLSLEETQRVFPRRGQQGVSEYVDALRELAPGEAASIDREGLSDRTIKRRLGQAAKSLGYRLKWGRHSSAQLLHFLVVGTPATKAAPGRRRRRSAAPEPVPPADPAAPRAGRGRRRRAA
jgi:hypothetical protein